MSTFQTDPGPTPPPPQPKPPTGPGDGRPPNKPGGKTAYARAIRDVDLWVTGRQTSKYESECTRRSL